MFFRFGSKQDTDIVSKQDLQGISDQLSEGMTRTKEDIEEHLQSINANTSEIDVQNTFICEMDNRLTKMEERMDEFHFLLKKMVMKANLSVELSKDEQRIFLILYTNEQFMSQKDVCSKVVLDNCVVDESMDSLMDKGIPIERELINGDVYFKMSNSFKLRQAKENVIKIDKDITGQYQNALLKQFFND